MEDDSCIATTGTWLFKSWQGFMLTVELQPCHNPCSTACRVLSFQDFCIFAPNMQLVKLDRCAKAKLHHMRLKPIKGFVQGLQQHL